MSRSSHEIPTFADLSMYLFFDTETTGTPRNYKALLTDLNNWPRLVQIAWILHDKSGATLATECHIIKPKGFSIPADASRIHGITTDQAQKNGADLLEVLTSFAGYIASCEYLVAHNINFDQKIVAAEFLRNKMGNTIPNRKLMCTMESSKNYCAIKGPYGNKWPSLTELHHKLFKCGFDGAHNALTDITITSKCFWELRKRGII